jgi:AraC-like DNA-binding protein
MTEATVAAGFAGGLFTFAVTRGADPAVLASRSGFDPAAAAEPDARVPFTTYVALMRTAKQLTGDAALALHFAETVHISNYSIVGLLGGASETIAEAMAQLNRFVRLVVDADTGGADRFVLERRRDGLWFIDNRRNPNAFPELTESAFAQIVCSSRPHGATSLVRALHLTHADPGSADEYRRIFGIAPVFGSNRNAACIDDVWLGNRVASLPRYVFPLLSERAEALLRALDDARSTRSEVERHIVPILHSGNVSMENVAQRMGIGRQTLYRRLKADGLTFEIVLDDLRRRLAIDYLASRRASVSETACLVGYSDPSAFSRAFKRWTGARPKSAKQGQDAIQLP